MKPTFRTRSKQNVFFCRDELRQRCREDVTALSLPSRVPSNPFHPLFFPNYLANLRPPWLWHRSVASLRSEQLRPVTWSDPPRSIRRRPVEPKGPSLVGSV